MSISLPVGTHTVMFTNNLNGCRDSIIATVTCPPVIPCTNFIAQSTITLPSSNCTNYFQQFCVEIPFMTLSNFNVKQNGQFYTGTTASCNFNGTGAGTGTSFAVTTGGTHTFVFTNAATGCADTVIVNAPCFTLSPEYLVATIYEGDVDTVCLDISELPGNVFTVENACPSTNEYVIFDRVQGTVCYLCTGIEKGVEKVCFVLCDDMGNCDSTFMTVNVLERDQSPAIGVVDMDTTITNTRIILDVLANDTVPTGLAGFQISRQPLHGTVSKNPDNKLVYTPFNNFCDSNTPDNFEYVVCNAVSCDTVTVYVWVLCDKIRIYSGFSPNNDMINDFFVIEGLHNFQNNELKIFNRWGNQVYQKAKYDNSWDGSWKNAPLPDGTYFYIFSDGEGNDYSGYIQMMR
jgi:gliding motility-associated-like protein